MQQSTTYPRSPQILKGGIVLINPSTSAVHRVITLQYNPDTLTRTLQPQSIGVSGDRSEALRLTGPPVETMTVEAEIDATDQLEFPDDYATAVEVGLQPQLAALETIVYPANKDIQSNIDLASSGTLEIIPMEAPLTVFVWSKNRVVPVRLTEFSITEEAFDVSLNPIRAKVNLGMRVLSVNDLPDDHKGASLFMTYHQQKESLAARHENGSFNQLGINGVF